MARKLHLTASPAAEVTDCFPVSRNFGCEASKKTEIDSTFAIHPAYDARIAWNVILNVVGIW